MTQGGNIRCDELIPDQPLSDLDVVLAVFAPDVLLTNFDSVREVLRCRHDFVVTQSRQARRSDSSAQRLLLRGRARLRVRTCAGTIPTRATSKDSGTPALKILSLGPLAARELTPDAMDTLKEAMAGPKAPGSAKITAAIAVLDRGWVKPTQAVEANVNIFDQMTDDEQKTMLAALEALKDA